MSSSQRGGSRRDVSLFVGTSSSLTAKAESVGRVKGAFRVEAALVGKSAGETFESAGVVWMPLCENQPCVRALLCVCCLFLGGGAWRME